MDVTININICMHCKNQLKLKQDIREAAFASINSPNKSSSLQVAV